MKKIFSLAVIVCIIVCCFAGCGGEKEDNKVSPGVVEITVPDSSLKSFGIDVYVKQQQDKFDELYGDRIKVTHVMPVQGSDTNTLQVLSTTLISRDSPAYVNVPTSLFMKDLYNMGLVKDLTKYIDKSTSWNSIYDAAKESVTNYNGAIVGYPNTIEVPLLGFYSDHLKNAGYNPDNFKCETWDDYYQIIKAMTKDGHTGSSLYTAEFLVWPFSWFLSNGSTVISQNNDGTISLNYANKNTVDTVKFFRKIYQEGLTNENIQYTEMTSMFSLMFQKKVSSFTMYPTWVDRFINAGIEPSEITLKPFPKGPDGNYSSFMSVAGAVLNANLTDEQVEATLTYLDFMNSEEYYEGYFKFSAENGVDDVKIPAVKDVDWYSNLSEFPEQWVTETQAALNSGSGIKFESTGFTTYFNAALTEAILKTPENKIEEVLKKAEETTKNEWMDSYNAKIKK